LRIRRAANNSGGPLFRHPAGLIPTHSRRSRIAEAVRPSPSPPRGRRDRGEVGEPPAYAHLTRPRLRLRHPLPRWAERGSPRPAASIAARTREKSLIHRLLSGLAGLFASVHRGLLFGLLPQQRLRRSSLLFRSRTTDGSWSCALFYARARKVRSLVKLRFRTSISEPPESGDASPRMNRHCDSK
jgi:hypothetical protein